MANKLNVRQKKFLRYIQAGLGQRESAVMAGYSPRSAHNTAKALLKNSLIIEALDEVGLNDKAIASSLKTSIESGLGVKATNSDAIRGLELASRLKGHLSREDQNLTQNNLYINELKTMDDEGLQARLEELTQEVQQLKGS